MAGNAGICEALTAMLRARTEWDEAPGLYMIYREADRVVLSERSLIPEAFWLERPAVSLSIFADSMEHAPAGMLAAIVPPDLLGVAFRCETWLVKTEPHSAAAAEADAMARARQLSTHPDRVEQRMVWAMTRDGTQYVAEQSRGARAIDARKVDRPGGLVAESLARMIRAMSAGLN